MLTRTLWLSVLRECWDSRPLTFFICTVTHWDTVPSQQASGRFVYSEHCPWGLLGGICIAWSPSLPFSARGDPLAPEQPTCSLVVHTISGVSVWLGQVMNQMIFSSVVSRHTARAMKHIRATFEASRGTHSTVEMEVQTKAHSPQGRGGLGRGCYL